MNGKSRPRWFAWWYLTIAAGFTLLAIQRIVAGGAAWMIALRLIIAAGFFALAWFEFRSRR